MQRRISHLRPTFAIALGITLSVSAQTSNPTTATGKGGATVVERTGDAAFFDPARPTTVTYVDQEVSMRLIREPKELSIRVQRVGGSAGTIQLPAEMVQVNQIRRVRQTVAVVIGMVNGSVSEVLLIDFWKLVIEDQFFAYQPTLSRDGRFITFVKFYPPHFVQGQTDKYMLYDVNATPSANRPSSVKSSDRVNVGTAVYPPHTGNRDGDNTGIPGFQAHHMSSEHFFWDPTSRKVLFADSSAGGLDLVIIIIDPTVPELRATAAVLPLKDRFCENLSSGACKAYLTDAEFNSRGVLLRLRGRATYASVEELAQVPSDAFVAVP